MTLIIFIIAHTKCFPSFHSYDPVLDIIFNMFVVSGITNFFFFLLIPIECLSTLSIKLGSKVNVSITSSHKTPAAAHTVSPLH